LRAKAVYVNEAGEVEHELIFPAQTGKPMRPWVLTGGSFKRLRARAGIERPNVSRSKIVVEYDEAEAEEGHHIHR
jgi:hypothetical protein